MIYSLMEVIRDLPYIKNHEMNLISIRDTSHSHFYDIIDQAGLKNLLAVQFDDLVEDLPVDYGYKEHPPSESDIATILEWAKNKMAENSNDFVVQCSAGVSRSSAVAILVQYLKDPKNALKVMNPFLHSPNMRVLELGEKLLNAKDIKEPVQKILKEHDEKWAENLGKR